ncbi:GtrA family protein [Saccharopolyspora flava]|uniref:Putative flippase GtrA (Transmembrane translocase of bactoprenol-linked glucose) n=1 Tax=Saccharopolyspora flava TaxID=95161 RepID=A0A1I6QKP5_9PSEU|nr:GtrA family protein [Saccharopolyspora flava]SFS52838.1 Putative flippase GtrA (transmembrane translocase of bactoprenol-linked glucose) [Saccharopolyspora flava]
MTSLLGKIARYGVVGLINTLVYYGAYLFLRGALPYLVAHLMAMVPAVIVSYFLNCRFTFRTRPSMRKFLLFPLTNITNFAGVTVFLYVLVEFFGMDQRTAPLLATVLAVPATFAVTQLVLTRTPSRSRAGAGGGQF